MKTIKLFKQETDHTCACAIAKMLLHSKGIDMSEIDIEKKMGTNQTIGTSPSQLMDFLFEYGFKPESSYFIFYFLCIFSSNSLLISSSENCSYVFIV